MKVSWNWLQRHVDLAGIDPFELADRFTMSVAELEGIEEFGATYDRVLAARILELSPLAGSDKLNRLELDLGDRRLAALSGAPGLAPGQMIPFAQPGVVLEGVPGKPVVAEVEIRGFRSPGVTCSERELGISDDHSGLMALPAGARPGQRLTELLACHDYVVEIDNKSITHRPDLWGHRGMAREFGALVGRPLKPFEPAVTQGPEECLTIRVEAPELCPRYAAQLFEQIEVAPSPLWLKLFLSLVGMRPISNIVDITNFVMLEVGNPLHAFDSRFVNDRTIIVRRAREGESIVTLDGNERRLLTSDLLIADSRAGIALAGVMGGEKSEIREDTTSVILEAAAFNASAIRRTSARLGLRSEASARFEKALDPLFPLQAAALFSQLLRELVPGVKVVSPLYDVARPAPKPTVIRIAPEQIRRKLGAPIEDSRMKRMLEGIEFGVEQEGEQFVVTVPTFRATKDITIPIDLVEEIGRLYGYDNIAPAPILAPVQPTPVIPAKAVMRQVRQALVAAGYRETLSYSFDSVAHTAAIGYELAGAVELANAISADLPVLRRHLVPNLLLHAQRNGLLRDEFRLFELGRVFYPAPAPGEIPHQERRVAGLIAARGGDTFDLYRRVRDHAVRAVAAAGRGRLAFGTLACDLPWAVAEQGQALLFGERTVGLLSPLHPVVRDALKLRHKAALFELNLEPLFELAPVPVAFRPPPRFPAVLNDLSVIVDLAVPFERVARAIRNAAGELLEELELFAIFRGAPIPEGRKSLSFHLLFRHAERTLTDGEVEPLVAGVLTALREEVGGEIRT